MHCIVLHSVMLHSIGSESRSYEVGPWICQLTCGTR